MKKVVADNRLAHFMDSRFMHTVVAILVILNAVVIAAKTFYLRTDEAYLLLAQIDSILLYIFLVEVGVRLLANGRVFLHSYWNIFDFIIIYGSLIPVAGGFAVLESLRALRLFYLIEISKKMRHILHGIYLAFPGIANVVLLLIIIFFSFALIGANLFKHPNVETFQDIGAASHALFQVLTGDDWYNVLNSVKKEFPQSWIFFYTFYIIMSFVFLNLFIGVVVGALQAAEEEIEAEKNKGTAELPDPVVEELKTIRLELAALKKSLGTTAKKAAAPKQD